MFNSVQAVGMLVQEAFVDANETWSGLGEEARKEAGRFIHKDYGRQAAEPGTVYCPTLQLIQYRSLGHLSYILKESSIY